MSWRLANGMIDPINTQRNEASNRRPRSGDHVPVPYSVAVMKNSTLNPIRYGSAERRFAIYC